MTSYSATPGAGPLEDGTTTNGTGPQSPTDESGARWRRWKRRGKLVGGIAAVVTAATAVWGIINTYGGDDYPRRPGKLRNQALATAELIIDYDDDIAAYVRVGKMDRRDHARWSSMMWGYFQDSAVTRRQWKHFSGSYDRFTACILGVPTGHDLDHWNGKPRPKKRFEPERC